MTEYADRIRKGSRNERFAGSPIFALLLKEDSNTNGAVYATSTVLIENNPVAKTMANLVRIAPLMANTTKKCFCLAAVMRDITLHGDM